MISSNKKQINILEKINKKPIIDNKRYSNLNKKTLFNFSLVDCSLQEMAIKLCRTREKTRVAFINAHCVNESTSDWKYANALQTADLLLPDGSGLSLASKLSGTSIENNMNGTDLFPILMEEAARTGKSVYLFGAAEGIAAGAAMWAKRQFPELKIAGTQNGYFTKAEEPQIISQINASGADIVLVAMGVPQQDTWLQTHANGLTATVTMGVGGLFDYYSGRIPRAPKAFRRIGCEWVWRLGQEPRRLAKRYLLGNLKFLSYACLYAKRRQNNGVWDRTQSIKKRILDCLAASLGLIALSPVLITVALAIKLTSPGPVFFLQTRVGTNGKEFKVFKFRSMYIDAEERRKALIETSDRAGICYKMKDDPRITPIGNFIRRFSIDELPQLINVLIGNMSLVGPRPALPCEVAQYSLDQKERLHGKPGITGIWQISGRADIPFEHQADMDIAYLKSSCLLTDIFILSLTPFVVLSGRGAY